MNTINIKTNFHQLIDSIENTSLLEKFYDLIQQAAAVKDGELWNNLSKKEQKELINIDKETNDDSNLIDHQSMKEKHNKWL